MSLKYNFKYFPIIPIIRCIPFRQILLGPNYMLIVFIYSVRARTFVVYHHTSITPCRNESAQSAKPTRTVLFKL